MTATLCREWALLLADEPLPADADRGRVFRFNECAADLWAQHGAAVTAHYAREHPGCRPSLWWQYPQQQRQRVGGTGSPIWEALPAYLPAHDFGLPRYWLTARTVKVYAMLGLTLDGEAIDPADPPIFESEATYLQRKGELLPGELARIDAAQFEFEPLPAKFLADA